RPHSRSRGQGHFGDKRPTAGCSEIVRRLARSAEPRTRSGRGRAERQPAGLQNRFARKVSLRSFEARQRQKTERGKAERDQVSGKHRRARLPDQGPSRRRVSGPRQQGSGTASISWPRNGPSGIRDAADGKSEGRSFRNVAGG